MTHIDRDRIEELPIPSRNYLNFTILAPAVGTANPAVSQYQALSTESGFTAGGLRPSSNALYIDGVEDNDEFTGLSRTELSPEAVSDFQVVNHGYAAQSGGSAGGAVDVETRSGADLQHGDANRLTDGAGSCRCRGRRVWNTIHWQLPARREAL